MRLIGLTRMAQCLSEHMLILVDDVEEPEGTMQSLFKRILPVVSLNLQYALSYVINTLNRKVAQK